MKVIQLRLVSGSYAIGGGDVVIANDKTAIDFLGGGNFLIKPVGKPQVFIPNNQVKFALCENDDKKKPQ